ncbi:Os09g0133800, partial [Oryza sativa Japonica Group]
RHELDSLRGKVAKQDSGISDKCRDFDVIVSRLEQALQHVHRNEIALKELNDRFRTVSDSQKEVEKQNKVLHAIIKEKEKGFSSSISKEKEFTECMRCVVESMRGFEKLVTDQQTIIAHKVQHNESRCLYFHSSSSFFCLYFGFAYAVFIFTILIVYDFSLLNLCKTGLVY